MSAALHATAHFTHILGRHAVVPRILHSARQMVRSMSNRLVRPEDYAGVNRILLGEAHEPYPSAPPDSNLFEDDADEYSAFSPLSAPSKEGNSAAMNLLLRTQLQAGDLGGALSIMDELEAAGVPIYDDAQYEIIEREDFRPEDARAFLRVWEHVRDYDPRVMDRTAVTKRFIGLLRPLFLRGKEMLPLVNFALLASRKGYARFVGSAVISHLVRYGKPEYAESFLYRLSEEARKHPSTQDEHQRSVEVWSNLIIRGQTFNMNVDYTVRFLLRTRNRHHVKIHAGSYLLLLQELKKRQQETLVEIVRTHALSDYPQYTWELEVAEDIVQEEEDSMRDALDEIREMSETKKEPRDGFFPDGSVADPLTAFLSRPVDRRERLAKWVLFDRTDEEAARYMRDILATPPHVPVGQLATFISDCISLGRPAVINLLDHWAMRDHTNKVAGRPDYWTARWTVGVMLYFYRRKEYLQVLNNYVARFQVYALPIDEDTLRNLQNEHDSPLKLWPSPYATAYAMQAMIWNLPAQSYFSHEAFYRAYMSHVRAIYRSRPPDSFDPIGGELEANSNVSASLDSSFSPAAAHTLPTYTLWHTFAMRAFKESRPHGRKVLTTILRDMLELGMYPNRVIWTLICTTMVDEGYYDMALYLCDLIAGREAKLADDEWHPDFQILRSCLSNLPPPSVKLHGAVLHECLKTAVHPRWHSQRKEAIRLGHIIRGRMIDLGWDPRKTPGMTSSAAMFEDLDYITHLHEAGELSEDLPSPSYRTTRRDSGFGLDAYSHFPPRTGKFQDAYLRLKPYSAMQAPAPQPRYGRTFDQSSASPLPPEGRSSTPNPNGLQSGPV